MLITPKKPQGILRIVLDSQKDEPAARQIVFVCRGLTLKEAANCNDMGAFVDGAYSQRLAAASLYAVKRALQRIEFGDEIAALWRDQGVEPPEVTRDEMGDVKESCLSSFSLRDLEELGIKIRVGAKVSEKEEGESEPPSA